MPTSNNPILKQPIEVRMWLESKMREDLTNDEILTLFNEKFPFIQDITVQNVTSYRKKYVPNYKELLLERYGKKAQKPESEIEEEILEAVKEAEEADEEFTKDEMQKINMLKAHKRVLKEMYENYKSVKNGTDENAKDKYLNSVLKCLASIREQEAAERDFLSAIADARKAEAKLTPAQYEDSIKGWWILRAIDKCTSKEEALKLIENLKVYLTKVNEIILTPEILLEDAKKEILAYLYVNKKVIEEEKGGEVTQ